MEGPIACRSSQGNLSVPVKVSFERSPPAKHIRSSDIPPTGESQGRLVQGRKPQSLLTACSLHRSHHSQIPHPKCCSPRVLPAWKLTKQQIEQRADDMAIKLATLETPGKQQEPPKPMLYSTSSYFGIIVLTAINRAHERSRQSTGQPCSTLNWQHQSRSLHSVQLLHFIPDF